MGKGIILQTKRNDGRSIGRVKDIMKDTIMKRKNWTIACALLGGLAACSQKGAENVKLQTVKVDSVRAVGEQTLLQYPGKVKAAQDISLAFRVSGTLRKMAVEEGAPVRQGQLLAELDPTDYQVQLDATEAEYRQVKADAERVMQLYADSSTTASNYDKAVYGLKQITAKYRHHQDQLAYTRLYAPFNGWIQKRLFDEHETVGAGMPVLSMIGSGMPEVEINLPAAEYINRQRFTSYHCTFDLYPGKTYPLKLISITPKANANQLYTMRLQLMAGEGPLPSPGMNTMVTIRCNEEGVQRLSVPAGALMQRDGVTQVWLYSPADGRVHACRVQLVRPLGDGRVIVSSEQLQPGQCVVSSGTRFVKEGEAVPPLAAPSATNVGGLL